MMIFAYIYVSSYISITWHIASNINDSVYDPYQSSKWVISDLRVEYVVATLQIVYTWLFIYIYHLYEYNSYDIVVTEMLKNIGTVS